MALLVLFLAAGCQQEAVQQKQQPGEPESNTGYLKLFDKDYQQHQVSNRMRTNIKRIKNSEDASKYHDFRSAGLSVYLPKNMTPSDRFTGFTGQRKKDEPTAAMVILTNPFSMEKTTGQIVSSSVHNGKLGILFTDRIEVDGREGVFYFTREKLMGVSLSKFIAAFGDDDFSWLVTATFTQDQEVDFGKELLKAVLNIKILDSRLPAGEDVSFTMNPDKLVLTDGFVDKLLFTLTGKFPEESTKEPIFQAGRSIVQVEINEEDKLNTSRQLIPPTPDFEINMISSEKKITIDGMDGYEFVSIGRDRLSDEPLMVYSAVVYAGVDSYLMHGWASSENEENYIGVFRRIANSLKRKDMTEQGDAQSTQSSEGSASKELENNEADNADSNTGASKGSDATVDEPGTDSSTNDSLSSK